MFRLLLMAWSITTAAASSAIQLSPSPTDQCQWAGNSQFGGTQDDKDKVSLVESQGVHHHSFDYGGEGLQSHSVPQGGWNVEGRPSDLKADGQKVCAQPFSFRKWMQPFVQKADQVAQFFNFANGASFACPWYLEPRPSGNHELNQICVTRGLTPCEAVPCRPRQEGALAGPLQDPIAFFEGVNTLTPRWKQFSLDARSHAQVASFARGRQPGAKQSEAQEVVPARSAQAYASCEAMPTSSIAVGMSQSGPQYIANPEEVVSSLPEVPETNFDQPSSCTPSVFSKKSPSSPAQDPAHRPHVADDRGDSCFFMQISTQGSDQSDELSEDSVIPEDWFLDLQRLAARLERQCHTDRPEEVLFTVYTWYIDHEVSNSCEQPKLATLGGYPQEWEEDLRFPWRHIIRPTDKLFIALVFPPSPRISIEEHIAHVLLSQRPSTKETVLLTVDYQTESVRSVIWRRAIAIPKRSQTADILRWAPDIDPIHEHVKWIVPPILPGVTELTVRNGMGLRAEVTTIPNFPDTDVHAGIQLKSSLQQEDQVRSPRRKWSHDSSLIEDIDDPNETHVLVVERTCTLDLSQHGQQSRQRDVVTSASLAVDAFSHKIRGVDNNGASRHTARSPLQHGIDVPGPRAENSDFEFRIEAPEFVPREIPEEHYPEAIHQIFALWGDEAFSWEQETASATIRTWMVDHRVPYPIGLESRDVVLYAEVRQWEDHIRQRWVDHIDPGQPLQMQVVTPQPPLPDQGITAYLILVQSPVQGHVSSLVSVDDEWMNMFNDNMAMRLVITTNIQVFPFQVVHACGFPVQCIHPGSSPLCQVWIRQQLIPPGDGWQGYTGESILLRILRNQASLPPQVDVDQIGLYQTSVSILAYNSDHDPDDTSLMARGPTSRRPPQPQAPVADMTDAVVQDEGLMEDPDAVDSDSSESITDHNWQLTVIFSPLSQPTQRQLNVPSQRLRAYQIATALQWEPHAVYEDYPIRYRPPDLIEHNLYGRLVKHVDEVPEGSTLALVLIDVVFHQSPPSWTPQTVRKAMYSIPRLTATQFLQAMYVQSYCQYSILPCLVYHNHAIWRQDTHQHHRLQNGDYLRLEIPPPNDVHHNLDTRCIAVAMHQGHGLDMVELFDSLPLSQLTSVPNPYQVMTDEDVPQLEPTEGVQLIQIKASFTKSARSFTASSRGVVASTHAARRHSTPNPPSAISCSHPAGPEQPVCWTPGIRTTPGNYNVRLPLAPGAQHHRGKRQDKGCAQQILPPCSGTACDRQLRKPQHPSPGWGLGCAAAQTDGQGIHVHARPYVNRQRLGEAEVPGPSMTQEPDQWAIGSINPTGMAGKAVLFTDLPDGIYAVSETHLTTRGKTRFKQELWHAKSKFHITTGYDAPYKKSNIRAVGGKHTGVGFMSTYPCRPLKAGWNEELFQSSRLHAATFHINQTCVAGGVCYGFAHAADSKATQEMTDQLLAQLTMQIVESFPGPAFIAGDFNQTPGVLAEPLRWEAKGWRDIQTWAEEHWGIVPGPTCCQVSRKDFVYLSPELQQLIVSCINSFDRFPDHSTLVGLLRFPSKPVPVARWPKPNPIDYKDISAKVVAETPCQPAPVCDNSTSQYAAICRTFEDHVSRVRAQRGGKSLIPAQQGRGQTLERTFCKPQQSALKAGRQGEFQPQVNSWSVTHCRWVTQCRRLQHYVKHLRKASTTPNAAEHRAAVWRAIVLASGFPGGFHNWWLQQAARDPAIYPWVPHVPPDLELAQHIAQVFQAQVEVYESRLIAKRVAMAKANRALDINRVFKDVRKPMPVPVTMLVAKAVAHVIEIVDEGSVIVDNSDSIQNASVLETRVGPKNIIHIEEGQVWFSSTHNLVVGDTVAEVNLQGQIHEIHDEFIREWVKRWDRHGHLAPDHWDEVLSLTQSLLHYPVMDLQPITLDRWKQAIKAKKFKSATGPDAVTRQDLLAFPDSLHLQLIQLFQVAESTGQWPKQLLQGAIHSLEKTPQAQTVNDYRPITVMPFAYRVYTTLRSREVLRHLKKHVPPTLLGNIPGRQATSLWWSMQHRIEMALQSNEPAHWSHL